MQAMATKNCWLIMRIGPKPASGAKGQALIIAQAAAANNQAQRLAVVIALTAPPQTTPRRQRFARQNVA
jgi:hypothetical protein